MNHMGITISIRNTRLITSVDSAHGARPLPPDLGAIREMNVTTSGDTVFADLPVAHLQPFWIDLRAVDGEAAILVSVQGVNSKTGGPALKQLSQPQNYYVLPDLSSPWVDGWRLPDGDTVAQFVFVDQSSGLGVAEHLLPAGLVNQMVSLAIFRPVEVERPKTYQVMRDSSTTKGVGAGGRVQQSHRDDRHDLRYWQTEAEATFVWRLCNEQTWRQEAPRAQQPTDDGFLTGLPRI